MLNMRLIDHLYIWPSLHVIHVARGFFKLHLIYNARDLYYTWFMLQVIYITFDLHARVIPVYVIYIVHFIYL